MLTVHDRYGRVVPIHDRRETLAPPNGGRRVEPKSRLIAKSACRFDPFDSFRYGSSLRDRERDDADDLDRLPLPSSDAEYCVWPQEERPFWSVTLDWVSRCRYYRTWRENRELDAARAARHRQRDYRHAFRRGQPPRHFRFGRGYNKPRRLARTARLRYLRAELDAYLRSCA